MRNLKKSKINTTISGHVHLSSYIHFRKLEHTVLKYLQGESSSDADVDLYAIVRLLLD
jgi:hypothetical protein